MIFKNLTKISALALIAGLSIGCATTGDLQKVSDEAKRAQATANDAKSTATTALEEARGAKALASDANARSAATEEKINRMFKKSMYK
jgi:murein lipoprotein